MNKSKKDKLSEAIGDLSDDLICEAEEYNSNSKIHMNILRYGIVAACAVIAVLLISVGGSWLIKNDGSDGNSGSEKMSSINIGKKRQQAAQITNLMAKNDYTWFGGCTYDEKNDEIKCGLVENTEENRATSLEYAHICDVKHMTFFPCENSYMELKAMYLKIADNEKALHSMGIESYKISIAQNSVELYLEPDADKEKVDKYLFNVVYVDDGDVIIVTILGTNDIPEE